MSLQVGLLVSPTDPSLDLSSTAAKSPFVIAIKVSYYSWFWCSISVLKYMEFNRCKLTDIECWNSSPAIHHQRGNSHKCLVLRLCGSFCLISYSLRPCCPWPCPKDLPKNSQRRPSVGQRHFWWLLFSPFLHGGLQGSSGYCIWLL